MDVIPALFGIDATVSDKLPKFLTSRTAQQGALLMFATTTAGSFLNFAYHFVVGRMLGPADHAALVALISMSASAPQAVVNGLSIQLTAGP